MQSSEIRLIVPRGLKVLLEGVSRAVVENNPDDIAQYFALYFQELVAFRKGHPNLDLTELVEKFETSSENGSEGLEDETSEFRDTAFSGEPRQRDKCTDTEEDQLLQEPDIQYSSKETQHPSVASSIAESQSFRGSDGSSSPEGPELAYVPAEPAELAAHVLAMTSSEAGQPPPRASMWTLYCLTDLKQGPKPPHSCPPAGAGASHSQAPLHLSRGEVDQHGQLSQVSAPIYVMQEKNKWGDAPPFILVRSVLQSAQDWKPIPSHAVFMQQDAAGRRFMTVPVPVARPADEETARTSSSLNSAEEAGAKTCEPAVLSVAIPLADVMMAARQGSPAGEKHTGQEEMLCGL
ncbi:PREDICTED: calcium-binding tyrosine phosphorylation-regulated protein [Buceros rhinoceros silvestris]|uniref:calcium-binding tyrosine phosphorylation-regulated protein n=1 Tax=Buceros rhinoceros silvestris TaxID=175836 RepID=UPI00052942E6|nr:PREDICTED: calcium-binding tyrosine phosphorylation-regulated protein [Buceros rhinoceros silvestris]